MIDLTYFETNIKSFENQGRKITRRINTVGTVRVAWFLSFLIIFVYLINIRLLSLAILSFVIFLIGFVLLVVAFNRLKFKQKQLTFLIQINKQEINRQANDFTDLASGIDYSDAHHFYSQDLDLFGEQSVFQLVNRTSTVPGLNLLVNRMLGIDLPANYSNYHESVKDLSNNPGFVQEYEALGMHHDLNAEEFDNFQLWLNTEDEIKLLPGKLVLILLPSLLAAGFILTSLLSVTYYILLPLVVINAILIGRNHALTTRVVEQTNAVVNLLKTYRNHIKLIGRENFDSALIKGIQDNLINEDNNAEKQIRRLSYYLDQLQSRTNLLHVFINIPFLLDLQWLSRLNEWKIANRENLNTWLDSLAEMEVLVSIAGTTVLNPQWNFPAFVDSDYVLEASEIGHPLINADSRITNSLMLNGPGKAVIITGPNMAGKSTFLRTIALNVVLAKMGAPVCAAKLTLSRNISVFTAMRTQDNLSENISSFYAELDRINQLLKEIESGKLVLYFLDELLKGTNSADRHKGAEALVKQLISLNVSGFVSTHDIELGDLTRQLPEVSNYSFESIITDGQIHFDYKIREGICSSFNASELMRQMGINV